jgi:uncharacterized protein YndB with AHSA1/START domain
MIESNTPILDTSDREIVFNRTFDAPRELVFEAWTRPEHLEKWWGPKGFTTTTHAFEFKPGGTWRLTMHGSDGTDFPNRIVYDEIVRPERIVYSHHGGRDGGPAQFKTTVTFIADGEKTKLTMRGVFRSAADRDSVVKTYGAIEGGKQTMERLAEHVGALQKRPKLHLSRVFDAPRSLVFAAWTTPEHLSKWYGPKGFTMPSCEMDFRPGGVFRFTFRGPDGTDIPFDGAFREVVHEERIVYVGKVLGLEVHTTLTFDERDGKTTLTVEQVYSSESPSTRGAPEGWKQTLDRLEAYVAQS